jgi:GH15 family glucan-1,4-alpha-glucosidase
VSHQGEDLHTVAEFTVSAGQTVPFVLSWYPSHHEHPPATDADAALEATTEWWQEWSDRCSYDGAYREQVHRSLITLKALTYAPTGGIVAAPTTSLPEWPGSVRNWDYRFCWLRDATLTLNALMRSGYLDEAKAWREWLLRAVAGDPSQLQIMYGVAGERRLTEFELPWLKGYEESTPVRTGNAASEQFQLDVYGEIAYSMYEGRRSGVGGDGAAWPLYRSVVLFLEEAWKRPDEGIWEVRGPRQHFTHSKVMAWVAFDRSVRALDEFGDDLHVEPGARDRFARCRDEVHAEVCEKAWNADRGAFMQAYGSDHLDAAVLQIPMVGFLPPDDPRVVSTVEVIERELTVDGLVQRYDTGDTDDGLPPGEGAFLPCSFWLVDALALTGRVDDAHRLFERLVGLANDVGLLAEEYDPGAGRLLGNFPQAFTHLALVNAAWVLSYVGEAQAS